MTDNSRIWSLDTSDMTLVELKEYRRKLLRQEEIMMVTRKEKAVST